MKKTVLRYGAYGSVFIILLFLLKYWFLNSLSYDNQEVLGWLSMVLAMVFVFFGIKYYRDKVNNGLLSFGQGIKVGLLIVLLPSIAFGLFDLVYVAYMDPGFMEKYYAYKVAEVTAATPPDKLAETLKTLEQQKEFFASPLMQFLTMAISVFAIGVIATVISSFILKRNAKVQYA